MHWVTISIPDEAFASVEKRARAEGFDSTEIFLRDLILNAVAEEDSVDHLFTPEVMKELEISLAEIEAGGVTYSLEDVRSHFEAKPCAWLER